MTKEEKQSMARLIRAIDLSHEQKRIAEKQAKIAKKLGDWEQHADRMSAWATACLLNDQAQLDLLDKWGIDLYGYEKAELLEAVERMKGHVNYWEAKKAEVIS